MKNITGFLSENFQFLEANFSIYLNRRVFVMPRTYVIGGFRSFCACAIIRAFCSPFIHSVISYASGSGQ